MSSSKYPTGPQPFTRQVGSPDVVEDIEEPKDVEMAVVGKGEVKTVDDRRVATGVTVILESVSGSCELVEGPFVVVVLKSAPTLTTNKSPGTHTIFIPEAPTLIAESKLCMASFKVSEVEAQSAPP